MEDEGRRMRLVLAGVLLAMVVGGVVDLLLDAPRSWLSGHVLYELALIAGGVGAAIWLWRSWARASASATALRRSLLERQAERDAWRERAGQSLRGLAAAVDAGRAALPGQGPAGMFTHRFPVNVVPTADRFSAVTRAMSLMTLSTMMLLNTVPPSVSHLTAWSMRAM